MNKFLYDIPENTLTDRLYLKPYKNGDGPILFNASKLNREHLEAFEAPNVLMHIENEAHAEFIARELSVNGGSRKPKRS